MRHHVTRFLALGVLVLTLADCMTFNHIVDHYGAENTVKGNVITAEGAFKIMDNASEGRMMITFAGMGTVTKGTPPLPWVRDSATAWLAQTNRTDTCALTEGYLFQAPQYEFRYQCDTPPPAQ